MSLDNSSSNNNEINKNIISLKVNSDNQKELDDQTNANVVADLATNQDFLKAIKIIMELGYLSKDELRLWLWLFAAGGVIIDYQRQIARELRMTRSSLSKALKRLTQYGMVSREDLYTQKLPGLPAKIIYVQLQIDVNGTIKYAGELMADFNQHVTAYSKELESFKSRHLDAYDKKYDISAKEDCLKNAMKNKELNKRMAAWYLNNCKHDDDITTDDAAKAAWVTIGSIIIIDDDENGEKYGENLATQDQHIPTLPFDVYEALVRVKRRETLRIKLNECCSKYMAQYKAAGYYEETRGKYGVKTGIVNFESIPLYVNF